MTSQHSYRATATAWVLAAVVLSATSVASAQTTLGVVSAQKPAIALSPADRAALQQFNDEIAKYLAVQRKLREELPVMVANSGPREINSTSDILAIAIQRSRPKAQQGDFFKPGSARMIRQRVVDVVRKENLAPVLAGIDDETPTVRVPRIYLRFPAASQMATMPPSLLNVLPELPEELEYRIIGDYLILRDVNAAIILDYLPRAVPRR